MVTTILMNVFSESIKETIFYVFSLLRRSEGFQDVPSEPVAIIESDDSKVQEPDTVPEVDIVPRQYSLRERKPVNYRE
jgi:hypothetical protein